VAITVGCSAAESLERLGLRVWRLGLKLHLLRSGRDPIQVVLRSRKRTARPSTKQRMANGGRRKNKGQEKSHALKHSRRGADLNGSDWCFRGDDRGFSVILFPRIRRRILHSVVFPTDGERLFVVSSRVPTQMTENSSRSSFPRDDGGFFFPRHQACLA
jgi:hypothetical protein